MVLRQKVPKHLLHARGGNYANETTSTTMQVSREVETEGRTCCEFVTQKVGARPCTALQRYQVASSSALICGRHFNKGVLDKEGAAEDFNHIDSDGSGFLRSVCVCACFQV